MVPDLPAWIIAIATLAGVLINLWNGKKIAGVHYLINSRMTELLEARVGEAHAAGKEEGRELAAAPPLPPTGDAP
jgi:hypothetical protein